MSDQKKRLEEGPPIWVESLLTPKEHAEIHKKYPQVVKRDPVLYDASHHKGGKWRADMGANASEDEIKSFNKALHNIMKTKRFQRRPDYGPNNEAKP